MAGTQTITVIIRKQRRTFRAGMTVRHTLEKLDLNPELYLVVRAGELLTEDDVLQPGDEVELVAVISGGRA